MSVTRRDIVKGTSAVAAVGAAAIAATGTVQAQQRSDGQRSDGMTRHKVYKIGTEEACSIPSVARKLGEVTASQWDNLDTKLVDGVYNAPPGSVGLRERLLDIEEGRLADMDENGVDMHLLSLTAPGVQMFDTESALRMAAEANDLLAETVRKHPTRFAALAAVAPQAPERAAKEMERAINDLKMNGFVINSHTGNEYLDQEKFYPILEAAEALDAPIYIHPRAPSDGMAEPFRDYRLEAAVWGYGVEVGTHVMRLMQSGTLDRFPNLQIVIGHMGEAIPFWLWRIDYMGAPNRGRTTQKLKASEYFQRNFAITTSGVEDPLAMRYCIDKIGLEKVMWAIDYPYQPTAPAVEFIETAPLTDEERNAIAHGNAERIFKIKRG